jgi:hypothetical protein
MSKSQKFCDVPQLTFAIDGTQQHRVYVVKLYALTHSHFHVKTATKNLSIQRLAILLQTKTLTLTWDESALVEKFKNGRSKTQMICPFSQHSCFYEQIVEN